MGARRLGPLDAVAFAGLFVFGIVVALLGAVIPVVSDRLALDFGDVGTLFLSMNGAMLGASLVVGPVMDRRGLKAPLAAGAALVAAALAAVAAARGFGFLLASVAVLGFGGGLINASGNTLVADLHEDPAAKGAALNLLGVFYGIGALVLPFGVGALLAHAGLAALLLGAAALCLALTATVLALPFPAPKQRHLWPLAEARRFARMPFVLALAFLLFFESGNEFVLGGYLATFLTRVLAAPVDTASYVLAVYWAAIMAGRLLLAGGLLTRIGPGRVVAAGALAAAAGALAAGLAASMPVALAGILVAGLGLSGVFPTVLGIAGTRFREHSGTVFGILFTVALTGGTTIPWVAGQVADAGGLRAVFVLAAANFVAVAALGGIAGRLPAGRGR